MDVNQMDTVKAFLEGCDRAESAANAKRISDEIKQKDLPWTVVHPAMKKIFSDKLRGLVSNAYGYTGEPIKG
jgi:hypothetical protein